jgi:hypothetical protein
VRAAALVALLTAAAPRPGEGPPADVEQRRAEIAKELIRLGADLEREILREDADALLARVPPDGLRCAGRVVPHAKVARDLRGGETWLHRVFFGGTGAADPPRAPSSLAAFLRTAREVAIAVTFHADPRAGPVGRPCLDFRAKDVVTPGAPLCFERKDGRWWFTESLYPCR